MRVIVDVSALLWSSLLGGRDLEAVYDPASGVSVNSAGYGYERAVSKLNNLLDQLFSTPSDTILVYESGASKAPRQGINPQYKNALSNKKPDGAYVQFSRLRDDFLRTYRNYGAIAVTQNRVEADDIIAWIANNLEEDAHIYTVDNDLMVLSGTNPKGFRVYVETPDNLDKNKYADFPLRDITIYKSLVGDSSDNIKGIRGFGPKAWEAFWSKYGVSGTDYLRDCLEKRDFGGMFADVEQCPLLHKIYYNSADLQQSYDLVVLRPEWVNTLMFPLEWEPGVNIGGWQPDRRFSKWEPTKTLINRNNQDLLRLLPQLTGEVAFDIETSTPYESDEWLEAQKSKGVDVVGSRLTGFSFTYGDCMQHSVYVDVRHYGGEGVAIDVVGKFLKKLQSQATLVIHNTMFEGTVLYNEFGEDWKDLGNRGLIKAWYDTKFEASYVDENAKLGLKYLSKRWLGYDQATYDATTTVVGATPPYPNYQAEVRDADKVAFVYKMDGLPAHRVFDYGCDDTICTAALHNFFKLVMQLESTWEVYKSVEIPASYIHVHAFIKGVRFDHAKHAELVVEDNQVYAQAEETLNKFLVTRGWEGSVKPRITEVTAANIKLVHEIVTGEPLVTAVRTPSKIAKLVDPVLASAIMEGAGALQSLVELHWKAAPIFNVGSPKQLQKLFYEVMALPVVVFNAPTENMRAQGLKTGTPKTDNLAIAYAVRDPDVSEEVKTVLQALQLLKMVNTRRGLYYNTYPHFVHWKTGRIHSQHNQAATNTRRASSSSPNLQQLSKGEKVEGFAPKIREMLLPHHRKAVIVSLDFSSQEVLLMAEWSKDPALESIFVGDNRKDFHSMTGVKIFNSWRGSEWREDPASDSTLIHIGDKIFHPTTGALVTDFCASAEFSYSEFVRVLKDPQHPLHDKAVKARKLAKSVNFGSQYRMANKKLSTMLFCTPDEAQAYLDAKAEAFPVAEEWSLNEMEQAKATGVVKTLLGAVRHLGPVLRSDDKYEAAKAERQAISFRIQGSAAEMTKLAEGRMWQSDLLDGFDCEYLGSIHDEVLWSVAVTDLEKFIPQAHNLMTANYANMRLPIGSSCSIGWNFGAQVELEGDFSAENIMKALETK